MKCLVESQSKKELIRNRCTSGVNNLGISGFANVAKFKTLTVTKN